MLVLVLVDVCKKIYFLLRATIFVLREFFLHYELTKKFSFPVHHLCMPVSCSVSSTPLARPRHIFAIHCSSWRLQQSARLQSCSASTHRRTSSSSLPTRRPNPTRSFNPTRSTNPTRRSNRPTCRSVGPRRSRSVQSTRSWGLLRKY